MAIVRVPLGHKGESTKKGIGLAATTVPSSRPGGFKGLWWGRLKGDIPAPGDSRSIRVDDPDFGKGATIGLGAPSHAAAYERAARAAGLRRQPVRRGAPAVAPEVKAGKAARLAGANLLARARAGRGGGGEVVTRANEVAGTLPIRLANAGLLGRARAVRNQPGSIPARLGGAGLAARARAARGASPLAQGMGGAAIKAVPRPSDLFGAPMVFPVSAAERSASSARRDISLARARRRIPGGGF